jgi:hypothetical protein
VASPRSHGLCWRAACCPTTSGLWKARAVHCCWLCVCRLTSRARGTDAHAPLSMVLERQYRRTARRVEVHNPVVHITGQTSNSMLQHSPIRATTDTGSSRKALHHWHEKPRLERRTQRMQSAPCHSTCPVSPYNIILALTTPSQPLVRLPTHVCACTQLTCLLHVSLTQYSHLT